MKAYVLKVLIIDHDEIGEDSIKSALENTRYPNRCVSPSVLSATEYEIGEWTDHHPLNQLDTDALAWITGFNSKVASPDPERKCKSCGSDKRVGGTDHDPIPWCGECPDTDPDGYRHAMGKNCT